MSKKPKYTSMISDSLRTLRISGLDKVGSLQGSHTGGFIKDPAKLGGQEVPFLAVPETVSFPPGTMTGRVHRDPEEQAMRTMTFKRETAHSATVAKLVDVDYSKVEMRIAAIMHDTLQDLFDTSLIRVFVPNFETCIDEEGCGAVFGAWEAMRHDR